MAIIASNDTQPKELIPAGVQVARCYMMIHIGTVQEVISGQPKTLNKVCIGWELPNLTKVYKEERGPEPAVISKEYTLALNDNANLRKALASWRGRDFTKDEAKSFDITKVVGISCMLNIIHKPKKSNPSLMYDEISSISPLMQGVQCPPSVNKVKVFEWDNPNWDLYLTLPKWMQDKIKGSMEYTHYTMQHGIPHQIAAASQPAAQPQWQQGSSPQQPAQQNYNQGFQQQNHYQGYQQPNNNPVQVDDLPF